VLSEKVVVCWQGEGIELGTTTALGGTAAGVGAGAVDFGAGDGAAWIWNVAADRWADAQELLDFYHASEHLWELGRALYPRPRSKSGSRAGCMNCATERRRSSWLKSNDSSPAEAKSGKRSGSSRTTLPIRLADALPGSGPTRLANCSGAVESACSGKQSRFKRRGQFWTHAGVGHLEALIEARENNHWTSSGSPRNGGTDKIRPAPHRFCF